MRRSIKDTLERILGPRTRAVELRVLRKRLAAVHGHRFADKEAVQSARRLRALRKELVTKLGRPRACAECVRPRSVDWPGGHCCSGSTEDLFPNDEIRALKLSGTRGRHWRAPRSDHRGCAFRGPAGCSLAPAHRPSLCVRYACFDLQREIDLGTNRDEINRLQEALRLESLHFSALLEADTERCNRKKFQGK